MLNNRTFTIRSWAIRLILSAFFASCMISTSPAQAPAAPSGQPSAAATPSPGQPASSGTTAAAAADKPDEPPTDAEKEIDAAIKKIAKLESVAADLLQEINMLNQKYSIKGRYLKAPNTHVYLKLTVSGLTDTTATSLQVCDGETLWDYQVVLDSQNYRKLSIKPILERLNSPELGEKIRDQALTSMGLAGPETLLVGLRKTIRFAQKEEDELDGKKVWRLRGTWRTRQGLVSPDGRPVAAAGFLPPYIPMDGTLYLGKEDGWPYKLVLVGRKPSTLFETRRIGPDGRPIGSKSSIEKITPSEIRLTYSDVKLNAKIRLDEFAFQAPPAAVVDDSTEAIVKGLDQAISMETQRKKSEAAKKEGPMLDQSIEIPSPPDLNAPRQ
jgi:outer membrane lipoprotein-sorting protein